MRDVYEAFRGRRDGIRPEDIPASAGSLTETEASLVEIVWREYSAIPTRELVERTHREPAWLEARAGLPADSPCDTPMSLDTMRKHFEAEARKRTTAKPGYPAIPPAEVWAAEEAYEKSGRVGTPAAEFFAGLLGEAQGSR